MEEGGGKLGVGEAGNAGLNTGDGERELKRWAMASSMNFSTYFCKTFTLPDLSREREREIASLFLSTSSFSLGLFHCHIKRQ